MDGHEVDLRGFGEVASGGNDSHGRSVIEGHKTSVAVVRGVRGITVDGFGNPEPLRERLEDPAHGVAVAVFGNVDGHRPSMAGWATGEPPWVSFRRLDRYQHLVPILMVGGLRSFWCGAVQGLAQTRGGPARREPMPLQEVTQCFAVHLQEFFSSLRMNRAVVDRYRVRIAGGPERPLKVDGWMVEDPLDDQRHDGMAVRRGESGVELIAARLERRPEPGRAPELTANVLARGTYGERFVDADFYTMVMSLEGLHRKLHSGRTGALTKAQAQKARRAIGDIVARAKDEGEIDDLIASTLKNRVLNS